MTFKRGTTQYNQPHYTTTRGDEIRVDGDRVRLQVTGTTYDSLGFQHPNPDGAANVLAVTLEQAYQQGQSDAEPRLARAREILSAIPADTDRWGELLDPLEVVVGLRDDYPADLDTTTPWAKIALRGDVEPRDEP